MRQACVAEASVPMNSRPKATPCRHLRPTGPGESYLTARFRVPEAAFDLFAGALWEAGTLGLEYSEAESDANCEIVAYFPAGTEPASVVERIIPWLAVPSGIDLECTEWESLEGADWNRLWRSCYRPIEVGRRLLVTPSWSRRRDDQRLSVKIRPEMAFGTGSHETTRLCLEALESRDLAGLHIADIGTGSGILALAAARLGARMVHACDVDPVALANARHNRRLNRLGRQVTLLEGDVEALVPFGPFDGAVANLVLEPIRDGLPAFAGLLKHGAFLFLSGLLDGQDATLESRLHANGLFPVDRRVANEWILLALEKSA
jgi:ribosomal protein L11 methyltransferase